MISAPNDDRDRSQQVAEHVHESAADIDIVAACGAQTPHDAAVKRQAAAGHQHHHHLGYRRGIEQPPPAFVKDPGRKRDQGQSVDERRKYAGAVIAVGLDRVRRPRLQIDAKPGEQQRQAIGEVMAGVGEQGQAVRAKTRHDFHRDKRKRG